MGVTIMQGIHRGTKIDFRSDKEGESLKRKSGYVMLTYTDAIASGNNEYTPVTMLLVQQLKHGDCRSIRPRDVLKVYQK